MPSNKKEPTTRTTKKATTKKATTKKATTKKATTKKATTKKATTKRATLKKPTLKKPTAKKAPARKPTAKKAPARKPTAKGPAGQVQARQGDLIVLDSALVGTPPREGEVLKVIRGDVSVSYQVRWADGHETFITPVAGTVTIVRT